MIKPWNRSIPAGDGAVLLEFTDVLSPQVNRMVHRAARTINVARPAGVWGIVPSYTTLLVEFDPFSISLTDAIEWLEGLDIEESDEPSRLFEIPVCYGGEFGPDLGDVSARLNLPVSSVIEFHSAHPYFIYCLGFSPGFPLCGVLPEALRVPRRASPRPAVPAGSVAIAAAQTGVYPTQSPGGWNIIGRTPAQLFFIDREPPTLYNPGDQIQFRSVSVDEFHALVDAQRAGQEVVKEVPRATP